MTVIPSCPTFAGTRLLKSAALSVSILYPDRLARASGSATVRCADGIVTRGVLHADAANLLILSAPAKQERGDRLKSSAMNVREREGLIARIRQIRRLATAGEKQSAVATSPDPGVIRALEARIAHLEQLVEGLQDSVHRESARQAKLISHLEARIQPSEMSAVLSKDARERGLQ